MTTNKLWLGPLPKSETVKLTFACPATLKVDLERYAELHAQTYGEPVDAVTMIPHMLEAFMAKDRGGVGVGERGSFFPSLGCKPVDKPTIGKIMPETPHVDLVMDFARYQVLAEES